MISHRGHRSLPLKWGPLHASAARPTLGASTMDASLGLNIFTILFLTGTFLAALVAGLGGFAFGIVAAGIWLFILTPLQTASLIMGLGLVVQGYSVWKLRDALSWSRLAPLLIGTAFGIPLGVFALAHADPHYLRLGIGAVLVLFSLYSLWRPTIKPIKADAGAGFLNGVLGGATGLARDRHGHLVSIARLDQGSAASRVSASRRCHFCDERRLVGRPGIDLARGHSAVC